MVTPPVTGIWIPQLYFSLPKMSIIWYGAQNSPYRGCRHTPGRAVTPQAEILT